MKIKFIVMTANFTLVTKGFKRSNNGGSRKEGLATSGKKVGNKLGSNRRRAKVKEECFYYQEVNLVKFSP